MQYCSMKNQPYLVCILNGGIVFYFVTFPVWILKTCLELDLGHAVWYNQQLMVAMSELGRSAPGYLQASCNDIRWALSSFRDDNNQKIQDVK